MKTIKILSFTFIFMFLGVLFHTAQAQQLDRNIGIGVMAGEPTGLSFKAWTSGTNAFDAGLAWSFSGRDAIHIHADYLWHDFNLIGDNINEGELPLYYGIGGRVSIFDDLGDDENAVFGVRVPIGINYLFEDSPFGLFLELAPIINLVPDTDFDINAAIGARYYL